MNKVWTRIRDNQTLEGDGFYVSYNKDTHATHLFTELGNQLGGDLKDGEETALCKDGKYAILSGDFREDYEKLIDEGWEACYKFFKEMQPEFGNNWSTLEEDRL